jgi:hypothetical protein
MEIINAMRGNITRTVKPDARPSIPGISPLKRAQSVGPKLAAAQAKPISIPLIVEVISGATLCPITIFAACPPLKINPVTARDTMVGNNFPAAPKYMNRKKKGRKPDNETESSFLGFMKSARCPAISIPPAPDSIKTVFALL